MLEPSRGANKPPPPNFGLVLELFHLAEAIPASPGRGETARAEHRAGRGRDRPQGGEPGGAEGRSDHPDTKQARPQTTQTSHPDHPGRPDQTTQTAQTAQTKTQTARAARRTQARPARSRPRSARPAQFSSQCGIGTGYYPIDTDLKSSESNHRDGSVISREACVREWQVELCNRHAGSTVKVTAV